MWTVLTDGQRTMTSAVRVALCTLCAECLDKVSYVCKFMLLLVMSLEYERILGSEFMNKCFDSAPNWPHL
jgi:hypothetical protein